MASLGLSAVKAMMGGHQRSNHYFTMLLTKTQLIPLPLNPLSVVSTIIPARTLEKIPFKDMGTTYNIAGDTTFEDWTVTIRTFQYLDYRQIKSWFEYIHSPMNGKRTLPKDYKSICNVSQIDHKTGLPLTNFILKGIFPTRLDAVEFSEEKHELVTFNVTFNIDDIIVL